MVPAGAMSFAPARFPRSMAEVADGPVNWAVGPGLRGVVSRSVSTARLRS